MLEFEVVGEMSQLLARTGEYNKFLSSCSHKRATCTANVTDQAGRYKTSSDRGRYV